MRLVWVVIPLVLFGIVGISESFAVDFSYNWGKFELNRGSDIDSPRVQFENGVERHKILCPNGLYLVYKTSDGSPACVKEYFSAPKLVDRGWATLGETSLMITTDKEVYSLGENVTITMKNNGETLLTFSGNPNFFILNESESFVEIPFGGSAAPLERLSFFDTLASTTLVWDQTITSGNLVKSGIYTVLAKYVGPLPSTDLAQLGIQGLETTKTFEITKKIWDTELENKSDIINGCKGVEGTWLDEHNECESGGITEEFENYCHDFNGEYDSCASGCRNYPAESDQVCITQCFAVCEFN